MTLGARVLRTSERGKAMRKGELSSLTGSALRALWSMCITSS